MRAALAQISPYLGDVRKNLDLHLEIIAQARREKADLLVFPELSLTGYKLRDLVESVAANPEKSREIRKLQAESRGLAIVFGFVEEKLEDRGLFYNSAAFCHGGRILHVHRKVFLPTYGMFEELRFFAAGRNFKTFRTPWGSMGLMICRDFLHYGASYLLFAGGAEIVIVASAAPGRGLTEKKGFASSRMWNLMGEAMGLFSQSFIMFCNRVGSEDGLTFGGGSFMADPMGRLVARAAEAEREFLVRDLDLSQVRKARKNWNYKRDEKPEVILEDLQRIVRGYDD
jgi:predicted amidohydrolase